MTDEVKLRANSEWHYANLSSLLSKCQGRDVAEEPTKPFAAFCGTWTDDEFNEFQDATRRTVNPEDWQ